MRLRVRRRNVEIGRALRDAIARRLRFVLARYGNRIALATVNLIEPRGAHPARGKRCRVVVRLLPSGEVSVEEADDDLGAAARRALDRVGQSVRRELERRREGAGRPFSE
jgi:ribosome-associated translation inhibitor RaiA